METEENRSGSLLVDVVPLRFVMVTVASGLFRFIKVSLGLRTVCSLLPMSMIYDLASSRYVHTSPAQCRGVKRTSE